MWTIRISCDAVLLFKLWDKCVYPPGNTRRCGMVLGDAQSLTDVAGVLAAKKTVWQTVRAKSSLWVARLATHGWGDFGGWVRGRAETPSIRVQIKSEMSIFPNGIVWSLIFSRLQTPSEIRANLIVALVLLCCYWKLMHCPQCYFLTRSERIYTFIGVPEKTTYYCQISNFDKRVSVPTPPQVKYFLLGFLCFA